MLKRIDYIIEKIEDVLSTVLFLSMVGIVCWGVICRYVLKIPFLQGEELARYLMIYVVYIGTSIAVKSKSHIGVEVFVDMLPDRIKKYVKIATEILCALIFMLLFGLSLQMLKHLVETMQMTTTTHIPTHVIFLCVPLGLFMSILRYICEIAEMVRALFGKGETAK